MSETRRNFYEILHVSQDAPEQIIRASYRTLMQQLKNHPDLGGDPAAAALINAAYAVLSDASRRALYDQELRAPEIPTTAAGGLGKRSLHPHRECLFCAEQHAYGKVIARDARCGQCHSPLALVDGKRLEERDARAVARIPKRAAIEFITHWPPHETLIGHSEDVSLTGMRLVTPEAVPVGQLLRLRSSELESVAQVVNTGVRQGRGQVGHESGVEFVTLIFTKSAGAFVSRRA